MSFSEQVYNKSEEINKIIEEYLPKEEGLQKVIFEAMNYSVNVGGKRLRPMLMMESAGMFNGINKDVYMFMAAIEIIHTYSLVHDDLPAMDNDDYRRGQLTTHKKYGHAMGVLTGDALLNYAYEICAECIVNSEKPDRAAKAFAILSRKAGVFGMVGGQTVDVTLTGKNIDVDVLNFIYDLKTGALIEAALMCGAVLAGANDDEVTVMETVGHCIGRAFQIQDDILDVISTSEELGKPVLSDEKNNKTTYVTLYGVEKASEIVGEISKEAINSINAIEGKNDFLQDLINYLITRKK